MILAQALPPLWMMIASVYLLVAVPATFVISLLIFVHFQLSRLSVFTSRCIPISVLPISFLNLGLTVYFFFGLRQPGEVLSLVDWAWVLSVVCSPILLIACSLHCLKAKRGRSFDA
jgi:hypothetical protein